MSASDTEATVRRLYRGYADQDGPALLELFANDLVLRASGRNPLSGDYHGTEQVFSYFGKAEHGRVEKAALRSTLSSATRTDMPPRQ